MKKQAAHHPEPEQAQTELARLATRLAPMEGLNATLLQDVTLLRRSKSIPRSPVLHEPSLVFVVQGRKRVFVGSEQSVYHPKTVLVLSAPIPFECIRDVPRHKPLLSVYIRLSRELILDVLSNMQPTSGSQVRDPRAIETMTLDGGLEDALSRLLRALLSPVDTRVLGRQTLREIFYRILSVRAGDGLRAMVDVTGHFAQVYTSLQRIHQQYSQPLEVGRLAREAGMSVSAFHLRFKQVTSTSPIQYVKAVRMHKARTLMLESKLSVGAIAARVGYKSASQFSREYKHFFGTSPLRTSPST